MASAPAHAQCTPASLCVTAPLSLGALGGFPATNPYSAGNGVNGDGSVVVGVTSQGSGFRAFRWTSAGGMTDLGTFGGNASNAAAVSNDGAVVVGYADNAATESHAFRWTSAGGMVNLGTLGGRSSFANGVNADGSVVVGQSDITGNATWHAFRWTGAGGMADLGTLPGGNRSHANGVSSDGSVVVGASNTGSGDFHAFRWTGAGGMADLGTGSGNASWAYAVNSNGSVVVGEVAFDTPGTTTTSAFRWTGTTGMVTLGTLGGPTSRASAVSGDGSVVVGQSSLAGGTADHAFRWTGRTGIADLNTLLIGAGVNMSGVTLNTALGISGNGQFIVGNGDFSGSNFAYIVRYDDGTRADATTPEQVRAGLTTLNSLQQSVNDLAKSQFGLMAQQHGLAAPLLGGNLPLGLSSEAGVFAAAGSAEAGGFARYSNGAGWSLLGGLAWARENYPSADLRNSFLAAAALQYIHDNAGWWHPFAEAGGWIAPGASFSFTRSYMNGSGTATGTGATHGDLSYIYARAGLLMAPAPSSQLALSGELGRERLRLAAYSEQLSPVNPFDATVASGTDQMDVAKIRLQLSHQFSAKLDGTLWAAGARGFNRTSDLVATVAGIGPLTPAGLQPLSWAEYGARIGYKVTNAATLDIFANGVSGGDGVGTRVHVGGSVRIGF